ncbi:hypothetical protein CBR_g11030 [Chara braunii]|uniref:Uncharacterized protein n=1 Tax=Chara braunii TaxID=69332 RepID=A0A388KPZ0_CHABU|nr:hypothetical protein CBR_g11030 [Chara braunii]|eukprot:GBG72097.1 hypothetical protein CBR_g11030 [Chara braunii]
MMEFALASSHSLVEDIRTIEEGPGQVKRHEDLMGGMYLLVNTLLQESLDHSGSLNPTGNVDEVPKSQDDEFEEGEIKEVFRAEEYDGIYLELGLLLSCEMRLRDASDRAQKMLQRYLVRDGHLFVRREVRNPRRVVCGRNRQIDVVAALHDGIARGDRRIGTIEERIQEASDKVARSRMDDKARWDQSARVRKVPLAVGDVVLLYDSSLEKKWSRKLDKRWSDFTKTAMPRGGKRTWPPQRSLGASRGYERHGLRHRESTPVYDDGDIELFLDSFRDHAKRMGWTVTQAIERLRGARRFEEPVARIRREATTRSKVEWRMQELRPSPVGPDGRPIRLDIENASDFIPAFEWFMQGQGIPRDDWMQTLPLWTRKAERPLASQVKCMARDWESNRAYLREAFRRPEPPQPRVERRQRSQRQRDPEPREARPSRGGRKALARREEEPEPEAEERGAYPECGLGPVEFHRFAEGELRRSPARTQEGPPASKEPLRELEAHLDISQWRASPRGEECGEQAEEVPREEVPREEVSQEEVKDTQRERGMDDEGRRAGKEVIEVGEDTPPQTPTGEVDKRESSRQGEQRQSGHGLLGQPSAAETCQKPPMGRVILELEEARAQREAEREAFEFRAPTELATLPIAAAGPVIPLAVEEGLPPSSSEPAQGSAEGSMDVLIEAVHSMQEEASLFSHEQRIEEPLEREIGIEAEGVIEGRLQRLGTPEYGPGGIEDRPGSSTLEVETREEPLDMPQSHELSREASEAPS